MSSPLLDRPSPGPQPAGLGRRGLLVGAALGLPGLLLIVAGSFLPWLTSGGVQRSSYAISGIVRRLRFVDGGPVALALSAWPALGAVAMLPILAGIVRWWRFAAVAAIALSVLTGVIGGVALAVAGGHRAAGISLAHVGPVVTVAGASTSLAGAIVVLTSGRALRRRRARTPVELRVSGEPAAGPFRRTSDSTSFVHLDGPSWRPSAPSTATHERSS